MKTAYPLSRLLVAILACLFALHIAWADEPVLVEELVRCSDLVALVDVKETIHDGIAVGPGGMLYTRHILKVKRYYVGAGPEELVLLTPGGYEKRADGRETFTNGPGGPDIRLGESFLAFLQAFSPGYRLLNRTGSKAPVAITGVSEEATVRLRFGKPTSLGNKAREQYEELSREFSNSTGVERELAAKRVAFSLTEDVPVGQVASRLEKVLLEIGGPKPPSTTCY